MSQDIVTETLANLYVKSGALAKAREIYIQLLEKNPDQPHIASKLSDLDMQIGQSEKKADFRDTLGQGLAQQDGMPLESALDEFSEQPQTEEPLDPELMSMIMVMTDESSLTDTGEITLTETDADEQAMPIPVPTAIPDAEPPKTAEALPQMFNRWLDLLIMKRKIDQLKKMKQRVS